MKIFGKSHGGGRRSAPREKAPLFALFSTITRSHRAIVVDISATGARLRGTDLPGTGDLLEVSIDGLRAFASIIWSDGRQCGIAFESPLTSAEVERLRQKVTAVAGLSPQLKAALDDWMTGFAR